MVPFLSFYSIRREGRYKKVRLKYPLSFNGILALILGYTHVLPSLICACADLIYTSWNPWCTLAPYIFLIIYKCVMCICNIAHSTFARFTRFSSYGWKSSWQCIGCHDQNSFDRLIPMLAQSNGFVANSNIDVMNKLHWICPIRGSVKF